MASDQYVWRTPRMLEPLIASAKSKWLCVTVSTVLSGPSAVNWNSVVVSTPSSSQPKRNVSSSACRRR